MRILGTLLLCLSLTHAGDRVTDEAAAEAIARFEAMNKSKVVEERQMAAYDLHDVPHPLVLKRLEKAMRERDPRVRNVIALAIGGQHHDVDGAGKILMKAYKKEYKNTEVLSSVLESLAELKYLGYWPEVEPALKDERNSIVIRVLDLLGENQDWRALPLLLEMYKVAMPKRVSWSTGAVKVDTGAAGDADAQAAKAEFNKRYGSGGSKEKSKAARKARAFDERNFDSQLRATVKQITGESFDNAFDFEDWYVENYIKIVRKIAEMDGKDQDAAEAKARVELPEMKRKLEVERKKMEEELATQAEK
jgi:hypothetical protein